jgi:hypothetical protein
MWALGARYCARQNAHAFLWLWALFLVFTGSTIGSYRSGFRFRTAVLALLALGTGALGVAIFYACYGWAPYSMGFSGPGTSAASLNAFMCATTTAAGTVAGWTTIGVACTAAIGIVTTARSHAAGAVLRGAAYFVAGLLLLIAFAASFLVYFDYSWCSSRRLF